MWFAWICTISVCPCFSGSKLRSLYPGFPSILSFPPFLQSLSPWSVRVPSRASGGPGGPPGTYRMMDLFFRYHHGEQSAAIHHSVVWSLNAIVEILANLGRPQNTALEYRSHGGASWPPGRPGLGPQWRPLGPSSMIWGIPSSWMRALGVPTAVPVRRVRGARRPPGRTITPPTDLAFREVRKDWQKQPNKIVDTKRVLFDLDSGDHI